MATIFQDGTLYAQTKLDMVNACLLAIGEVPFPAGTEVNGLPEGTDGAVARQIVEDTMIEVQNRGWFFNTDYLIKLIPDSNNTIALPANVLRIDPARTQYRGKVVMKNGKLYNLTKQTYQWTGPVEINLIYLTDYSDLPAGAFQYISLRAARKFQQRVVGSQVLHGFTLQDEVDALTSMQREHSQYRDYNLARDVRATMRGFNPLGL